MSTGRLRSKGAVRKCSSIWWKPSSMAREVVRANGQHRREADRRVHGVAPADPVPELEHVGRIDAELRHFRRVRRDRDKMLGDGRFVAPETREQPVARRVGVGHRLQRREGFRRDDEQGLRRVEVTDGFREVGAIDVRHEAERHGAVAVMLERLVGHHRPEVGAADADVDDVANALAGVALPGAAAHAVAEVRHLVEHGVHLGHHVLAVDDDGGAARRAQGHVQDRAIFRDVDLLTPEHGVDARAQAGFLGQLQEELEGFVGDAVLRVIEVEAHGLDRQALAACGIIRKELAEMQFPDLLMVGREGLPGRACGAQWAASAVICVCPVVPSSLPQAKPSQERIGIVARRHPGGSSSSFLTFPPPKNHVVRFQSGHEASHHVRRRAAAISSCPAARIRADPT